MVAAAFCGAAAFTGLVLYETVGFWRWVWSLV